MKAVISMTKERSERINRWNATTTVGTLLIIAILITVFHFWRQTGMFVLVLLGLGTLLTIRYLIGFAVFCHRCKDGHE